MSASRVTGSVSELVSFINSKVQTNIVESNNLGMNNVESAVKEYKEEVQKTIKYKKEVRKARK